MQCNGIFIFSAFFKICAACETVKKVRLIGEMSGIRAEQEQLLTFPWLFAFRAICASPRKRRPMQQINTVWIYKY